MEEREVLALHLKNSKLYSATIELCKTCNWNCKYCYLANHSDKGLQFEALTDLLRQLREAGCFEVVFTGGEIFTRKDAMEVISYARRLGFAVNLMTNLSLLSHSMLDSLKAMNVEGIDCSLFSFNPLIHDAFVEAPGAFSKMYENLFYCKQIGLEVQIAFSSMTINSSELAFIGHFSDTFGFHIKYNNQIMPSYNQSISSCQYALTGEALIEALSVTDRKMGVEYIRGDDDYLCGKTHGNVYITANGDVLLCELLKDTLGNIQNTSLVEILLAAEQTPTITQVKYAKWSDLSGECQSCADKQYCVRCPGVIMLEGGDYLGCSPTIRMFAKARHCVSKKESEESYETTVS